MYASEQESIWNKVAEVSTWVLLFIALVPGTALGYFAENSLPNSPLYPVKRGIETVVLSLVSLNSSTKSFYQLSLANTRVSETQQLFASSTPITSRDISQLDAVTSQLAAANEAINSVNNPTQKAQLHAQLQTTITRYQTQLSQLNQQLSTNSSEPNTTTQTNTTKENTSSPQPTLGQSSFNDNNNPSPSPSELSSLTQSQKAALQQQIQQTSDELNQLEESMQKDNQQKQHLNRQNNDGNDFHSNN